MGVQDPVDPHRPIYAQPPKSYSIFNGTHTFNKTHQSLGKEYEREREIWKYQSQDTVIVIRYRLPSRRVIGRRLDFAVSSPPTDAGRGTGPC